MKIFTVEHLKQLLNQHGFQAFVRSLLLYLKADFSRWEQFNKIPRVGARVANGIIELMPIWDLQYYSFKYVTGHPQNPTLGKQTVIGLGLLSEVKTGYPLLLSEMTVLTALRTAATSALASDLLARADAQIFGIIGTGAQSEFQVLAHRAVRPIQTIRYFDIDPHAMRRFSDRLKAFDLTLVPCDSAEMVVLGSDIVTLSTAAEGNHQVIQADWIKPGMHINAIGGDSPGKTELPIDLLKRAHIVVEFMEQSRCDGEIQQLMPDALAIHLQGELWEYVTGRKKGRVHADDITIFDSVGFALEDYSALRLVHDLSERYQLGLSLPLVPELSDPKDLIGLLGDAYFG